jgi:LPPG:FO 2-phospho-L-lactate transferase
VLTALAGGVGAARFLAGLAAVVDPSEITAIVNTGDDFVLHGLRISPDLDTVTYTLARAVNPETGWGLRGETWTVMDELAARGGQTWFRLGDRDLATHLYRTHRAAQGASLSEITSELARSWRVAVRILPMCNEAVETRVTVAGEGEIGFQDYFVGRGHSVPVTALRFAGVQRARPGPGVIDALAAAERVIICPSNPLVSIGPILAVPRVEEALASRRDDTVAVSPIIAGAALKGPADRMLRELGHEASVVGVARLYAKLAGTLVIDTADADRAKEIEAEGLRCVVAPTIMSGPAEAAALARVVLDA